MISGNCNILHSVPAGLVIVGIDKLFIGPEVRREIARAREEAKQKQDELWCTYITMHRKYLVGEKLANLANHELFAKIPR